MLNWQTAVLVITDLCCLVAAIASAFLLVFDWPVPAKWWRPLWPSFAPSAVVFAVVFRQFRLYRMAWRFASLETAWEVVKATTVGFVGMLVLQYALATHSFPRKVLISSWLLSIIFVGSTRMLLRVLSVRYQRARQLRAARGAPVEDKPVLVVGAGEAGVMIVDGMRSHPETGYRPLGFIDDRPGRKGSYVANLPVLGTVEELSRVLDDNGVKEVVIALPAAEGRIIRLIVQECARHRVPTKIVPGMVELISRSLDLSSLRQVQVEDLLRRSPVQVDLAKSSAQIRGKRILITGAGGSIGSELTRQVWARFPAQVVLLGHGEHSLHELYQALAEQEGASERLITALADIQDAARVNQVFAQYRPQVVFHAAAHKHVPLMEAHPAEAVKNNVLGTQILMDTAVRHGVEKFVLISTDKAVRPTSILGATKRVAEMLVQSQPEDNGTQFVAVRFGNVLGSRGSVLSLFKRQIARGGPVRVTHEEMTRYFMTVPEAVLLILQAAAHGRNGEVYVLDMGEPVKVADLARDLIRLSGYEPEVDIAIEFIGPRPGEKLREELTGAGEALVPTQDQHLLRIQTARVDTELLPTAIVELARLAERGEAEAVVRKLQALVPDYTPSPQWQVALDSLPH